MRRGSTPRANAQLYTQPSTSLYHHLNAPLLRLLRNPRRAFSRSPLHTRGEGIRVEGTIDKGERNVCHRFIPLGLPTPEPVSLMSSHRIHSPTSVPLPEGDKGIWPCHFLRVTTHNTHATLLSRWSITRTDNTGDHDCHREKSQSTTHIPPGQRLFPTQEASGLSSSGGALSSHTDTNTNPNINL